MRFIELLYICFFAIIAMPAICAAQTPSNLPTHNPAEEQNAHAAQRGKTQEPQVTVISTFDKSRLEAEKRAPERLVEPMLSLSQIDDLKNKVRKAVFIVHSYQAPVHELVQSGTVFDGAAVALDQCPDSLSDVATESVPIEETNHNPSSFFDSGLSLVSSPFAQREEQVIVKKQTGTCYLTTADWLTLSQRVEITIGKKKIPATIALRDDDQNVVVLKTETQKDVVGLKVAAYDAPQPGIVYALLSPGEFYESFTQHSFAIEQPHLYAQTTLLARNGYPLINAHAEIVGLTVSPNGSRTKAFAVHYALIDRALNPEKYNRNIIEKSEFIKY